jgi:hypothetical protein
METMLLRLGWIFKGKSIYSKDSTVLVVGTQSVSVYTITEGFRQVVEFDRKDARIKAKIPRVCTGISDLVAAGISSSDLKDILHMVGAEKCPIGYRNYWHSTVNRENFTALVDAGWLNVQGEDGFMYALSQKTLDVLGIVISD